ncbi:hypothetical protein NDU88_002060 [Pleurodeles waltl]|uniref:Reverse transcriptase zinc-binding domain-containing protein n=1 Tax=Pleurodeles waltl TaxID=8319 RepID=A0AAV7SCN2_PLEWA|nr:hypothetical protein NDU88_002060 [Pleurodeles waltl]
MRAAWHRALHLLGIHPFLHAQAPLWNNDSLQIGRAVLNWLQWSRAGIDNLAQVLEDGAPKTFAKLQEEYNLHPQQEWGYLQLKHCLQQNSDTARWGLQTLPVVAYLKTWGRHKGVMADLYEVIMRHLCSQPLMEKIHLQRQGCLQRTYDTEDWTDILDTLDRGTHEAGLKFFLFKIIHDWCWTPVKLHRTGPLPHTNCCRCPEAHIDLLHIICGCPLVQPRWNAVGLTLAEYVPL